MATKTSILIFYLKLSRNTQKTLRLASWAVLGIVIVAGTILTFMNIFQCTPISAAWDINVDAIRCIPLLTEFICSAPVNVTTDLAILALPIPVLTSMRLPPRQKTILVMTFALGIFVTVIDVVRIYYLQQAINRVPTTSSSGDMYGRSPNFSWNASFSLMWSAVEVNVGIICACIPTLKPLIIRILPAMILDPHGTRRSSTRTTCSSKASPSTTATMLTTLPTLPPPALTSTTSPNTTPPRPSIASTSREISIRDFLATTAPPSSTLPNSSNLYPLQPSPTGATTLTTTTTTTTSPASSRRTDHYFHFINLAPPKSMLTTTSAESLRYCTAAAILFFLWGFSYGLLNTLNNVLASVVRMSVPQTLGLTAIYFGAGYLTGPLLGGWLLQRGGDGRVEGTRGKGVSRRRRKSILKHHGEKRRRERGEVDVLDKTGGFKATFITGLLIYGVGTIMFWPGAVLGAYGGFMVSSFVVGFGLGVLETAANPFLVLCGPAEYADVRLLLAQGVQAVGSVLSGLLADRVFFVGLERKGAVVELTTLVDVQWTYLGVTLLSVLLALFFYYMPLPEVGDAELEELAARLPVDPTQKFIGGLSLRTWTIGLAVAAQFCYVSAQENMSLFFQQLVTAFASPPTDTETATIPRAAVAITRRLDGLSLTLHSYLLLSHSAFAISRFLAAILCFLSARHPRNRFLPTARTILTASVTLATLLVLAAVVLPTSIDARIAVILIILFFFFEGPIYPLTFSLGLRGQGARTKRAAAWLVMACCGPGVWPFVAYGIVRRGGSVQVATVLVVVLVALAGVFPAFLGVVRRARAMVDPVAPGGGGGGGGGAGERGEDDDRRGSSGGGSEADGDADRDGDVDVERGSVERTTDGGVLGQRLSPGWPGARTSWSEEVCSGLGSGEQGQRPQQQQQQQAPWESEVLDTSILQA